jgi:hypothetical protein
MAKIGMAKPGQVRVRARVPRASSEFKLSELADAFFDERPHLVRLQFRAVIDDLNRNWLGFEFFEHVPKLAAFPFGSTM